MLTFYFPPITSTFSKKSFILCYKFYVVYLMLCVFLFMYGESGFLFLFYIFCMPYICNNNNIAQGIKIFCRAYGNKCLSLLFKILFHIFYFSSCTCSENTVCIYNVNFCCLVLSQPLLCKCVTLCACVNSSWTHYILFSVIC